MKEEKTTREILIDAAAGLAQIKGFDRTSVQDIMRVSGIGKGSFYHYFESKDALGIAVLERDRVEFMRTIDECFQHKDALDSLYSFFDAALSKHSKTGFTGGCIWGNTALEMSDNNPLFADFVRNVFEEWIYKVEDVINRGQQQESIRSDVPAHSLAQHIVMAIEGGIMLSRLRKNETPLKECLELMKIFIRPPA